ncbi:low-density lipoprotein receptor-related protein 6-like [Haliotis asinina]|uniref:low-density lipoprotein receptor-related protein 6-like n=1 Tax=Haliotis asinina TaxID=109174 RepID=UPI003531E9BE
MNICAFDTMATSSAIWVFIVLANTLSTAQSQGHPEVVILLTQRHTFLTPGSVHRWDLYGDTLRRHPLTSIITPSAIDYDNVTRRIYWTDISREEVRSAELSARDNTLVAKLNNISYPEGLTVDGDAGKIFYTDRGNKVIVSINMNGFARTTIVNSNINYPQGIVADKTDRKLYWVDHLNHTINSCNYDGSGRRILVSTDVYAPMGVTINEKTGRLYWCEYNGNVYSIMKDGTQRKTHYTDKVTKPHLMDIAVFNGFLYVVDRTKRKILVIPEKDHTQTGLLYSGSFNQITGIHVFSPNSVETDCADGRYGAGCTSVCGRCAGGMTLCEKTTGSCLAGCDPGYTGNFCTDECGQGTYGSKCSERCGHCQTGTTCHHVTGHCPNGCQTSWTGNKCQDGGPPEVVILLTQRHTLLTPGSVYRWDLYGDKLTKHPLTSITTPSAIDYDKVTKRIYWTDISREEIRSAELTARNNILIAKLNNISYPEGLTVDGDAGKIFYTDRGNKVIVSINLNGFARTTIASSNVIYPKGIIADKHDRKLYWVDHSSDTINTCNYDGSGRRTVVSHVVNAIYAPMGVTINEQTGRLYWCEYNGNVYSIMKDGTQRKTHYTDIVNKPHFMDLAVFNGFLYVVDRTNRNILVIPENDDHTHTAQLSSGSFNQLTGIHVFSPNSVETGCAGGRYGVGCTRVCGQCAGGTFLCEKTTGFCLAGCGTGYSGNFCAEKCSRGTYGMKCSSVCGNCQSGTTCQHKTGYCPSGCQPGWTGNTCKERVCSRGLYGSSCQNRCGNCKFGGSCSSSSGACPAGCSAGWRGSTCKQRCLQGTYGEGCIRQCGYCLDGDICDPVSGACPTGCQSEFSGKECQDRAAPPNDSACSYKAGSVAIYAVIIVAVYRSF